MQPQKSTDAVKEQHLVASRERKRGLLQQELATARKAVRRRLKEVDGPRMRSDIQHKVLFDKALCRDSSSGWTQ